ncbi:hypothetical protein [Deinococcus sp. QL22]|uniref:hypothetical protein n=1 Tax=Deinococcus sp. QL22 TaxID=2939437 RepID=UPI00201742A9|nr:hypothetical protein [Deinococcus sp. QL22]UQN08632.1 hypothetical protein M1R55_21120 [Deinococcus sp. QL22]
MKKLLVCLLLVSSPALAGNSGPDNLRNINLCFGPDSVQIAPVLKTAAPGLNAAIYEKINTKLRAHRIPFLACQGTSTELYIQMDSFEAFSGNHVYMIALEITAYDILPQVVVTWSAGHLGSSGQRGKKLTTDFTTIVSGLLDQFAADYATANP